MSDYTIKCKVYRVFVTPIRRKVLEFIPSPCGFVSYSQPIATDREPVDWINGEVAGFSVSSGIFYLSLVVKVVGGHSPLSILVFAEKMKTFTLLFFYFVACCILQGSVDLYVADLKDDTRGGNNYRIVHKISFVDGKPDEVTEVLRFKPNTSMIFDGQSRIIGGRCAITPSGHIIDLLDKVLLFGDAHRFEYLGLHDGVAYYRQEKNWITGTKPNVIFTYDPLTKRNLRHLKDPDPYWLHVDGRFSDEVYYSPDKASFLFTKNFGKCEIWISDKDGETRLVEDMWVTVSDKCSDMPSVPVHWLNDRSFLTQSENGRIVVIDRSGEISEIMNIECTKSPFINPYFENNLDGEIVYWCGKGYIIDINAKSHREYEWRPLGSGFYSSVNQSESGERTFRYNEKDIGKIQCVGYESVTSDGFVATTYGARPGLGMGYPKGVAVWNTYTEEWIFVDFDWVDNVIGFIPNGSANKAVDTTATSRRVSP